MDKGLSYKKVRKHKSLVESIVEDLQDKIIMGQLKPGQRMVEAELCEKMGISRSPLREAFRVLESQGFLAHEPRKGMHVSRVSLAELENIYAIRANLESLATKLAVQNGDPQALEELKKLHHEMIRRAEEGDTGAYHQLNLKFHGILTKASRNQRLTELIDTFVKQTNRYRVVVFATPGKLQASIQNHEELIRSFEKGDAQEAERMRKEAILNNIAVLREHFREEEPED
ncbi:GntR family transcriptional regulator [bacterium]|nr:GntR family transcriptional regulator [bacterium]